MRSARSERRTNTCSDGNIRYFEYENDKFEFLSEYKSVDPQRGIAFLPKRGVDLHDNEVARAFKTVNDAYIEPISFIVPRRAEVFQGDVYPPTTGTKPALSSSDYFAGKPTAFPPKISLESVYDGKAVEDVPAEQVKPRAVPTPVEDAAALSPIKNSAPAQPIQEPPATQSRVPQSSLSDNKGSISALASKFADKDDAETSDASSFEEIPRPVERPSVSIATKTESKPSPRTPSPTKTSSAPLPVPGTTASSGEPTAAAAAATPTSKTSAATTEDVTASPSSGGTARAAADGIRGVLQEIKGLLAAQGQVVRDQGEKIEILAREVASLKSRLGE